MSDTSQPVAGWYPDPENPAAERWWDGTGWTDHRRASTVAPASPGGQPGPSYGGVPPYGSTPAPTSPYGAPLYTAPPQQGNTLAVVGFVLALGGLVISFGGLTALAGAIVSIFALVRANRMRAAGLVDHCLVVPSASIHHIQECHVAAYHILWDLVHTLLADERGSAAGRVA